MNIKVCFFLQLVSLFFLSCTSVPFSGKTDVHGMVYDFENEPIEGYSFYLEDKLVAITDVTGRFSITDLSAGTYTITGLSDDYENYTEVFTLFDKKQILYIRTPSMIQLLDLADQALAENNLIDTKNYIDRIFLQWPNNISTSFYRAVLHLRNDEITEALVLLHDLEKNGYVYPAIYLFLADIYQYKKNNIATAIIYLQKYLELGIDIEQEKRLQDLQK